MDYDQDAIQWVDTLEDFGDEDPRHCLLDGFIAGAKHVEEKYRPLLDWARRVVDKGCYLSDVSKLDKILGGLGK